jgi:uncharacterized OsmC-like protein
MEITVQHLGAVQFEVKARQHTLLCDQPEQSKGFDEGMTPPELLLASLGTCAGYYAAEYLRAARLEAPGMRIHVSAQKAQNPPRIAHFDIHVEVPAELDEKHREGVLKAVHKCLIHHTLLHPPTIETTVETFQPAAA